MSDKTVVIPFNSVISCIEPEERRSSADPKTPSSPVWIALLIAELTRAEGGRIAYASLLFKCVKSLMIAWTASVSKHSSQKDSDFFITHEITERFTNQIDNAAPFLSNALQREPSCAGTVCTMVMHDFLPQRFQHIGEVHQ